MSSGPNQLFNYDFQFGWTWVCKRFTYLACVTLLKTKVNITKSNLWQKALAHYD